MNELNDQAFVMVESTAFFESYRHVLDRLKEFDADVIPFAKHIVFCEKDVEMPRYLMPVDDDEDEVVDSYAAYDDNTPVPDGMSVLDHQKTESDYQYDFRPILKNRKNAIKIPVLDLEAWPSKDELGLDQSQLNALKTALTKEFAIIQGPPGTGKTYIGLKIVQMLLYNHRFWSQEQIDEDRGARGSPILVVCYTNHALDQFLEGILSFLKNGIVRIGSRSKSEVLEKFNISKQRDRRAGIELFDDLEECSALIVKEFNNVKNGRKFGLGKNVIQCFPKDHIASLMQGPGVDIKNEYIIAALHYWLLERILDIKEPKVKECDKDEPDTQAAAGGGGEEETNMNEEDRENTIDIQAEADFLNEHRQLDEQQGKETKENTIGAQELVYWHSLFDHFNESAYKKSKQKRFGGRKNIQEWKAHHTQILGDLLVDASSMSDSEAQRVKHIWGLNLSDRWRIYRHWFYKWSAAKSLELATVLQKYDNLIGQLKEHREEADRRVLMRAKVIGMTTTGASKYGALLKLIKPKIVIVEEAAEVLESHIICSLSSECQHLILIGDHEQLRPNPTVFELNTRFNLGISLFERMVRNGLHCEQLCLQHRMRPEIAEMMNFIYDNLQNHDSVYDYADVHGVDKNIFFIEHQEEETFMDDIRSYSSSHEARFLVELCQYFLKQGYEPTQITILTMYTAQLIQLKNLMPKSKFFGVRICPVDNFQGEENDIILLSLVRSNPQGKMGFLSITNRVCVALSRAKMGFYCIGNFRLLGKNRLWGQIIKHLQGKECIGKAIKLFCRNHPDTITECSRAEHFKVAPEGGCNLMCETRLDCGHACRLYCHPTDHSKYQCRLPCARECEGGHPCKLRCYQECQPCMEPCPKTCERGHPCKQLCHERCQPCKVKIDKIIPSCGHTQLVPCWLDPDLFSCMAPCPKTCEKEHPCKQFCHERCKPCKVKIEKMIPSCGHTQLVPCWQDPITFPCMEPCPKACEKDHPCKQFCYEECKPCEVKIGKIIPSCGHVQLVPCWQEPGLFLCKEPCPKGCANGHPCQQLCHELCKPCEVKITKIIPSCGHTQMVSCWQDPSTFSCMEPCQEKCTRGHPCPLLCHEGCKDCQVKIPKVMPTCLHVQVMKCSKHRRNHDCQEPCNKVFDCGHKCTEKCSDECPKMCRVMVNRTLPTCGHTQSMECTKDLYQYKCIRRCERPLPCGHPCTKECSEECTENCQVKVLHTDWPCRHKIKGPCYLTANNCSQKCGWKRSCEHICREVCGSCQTKGSHPPCEIACGRKLNCGHTCSKLCHEECDTSCLKMVECKLPECGHTVNKACCEKRPLLCLKRCSHTLPCGHRCQGQCGVCRSLGSHSICEEQCNRRLICGHTCSSVCYLPCGPCQIRHHQPCQHGTRGQQCQLRCVWGCKHHQCTRRCYEPCNRPPCDQPCHLKLRCKHKCIGLCSEPCPQLCRVCNKPKLEAAAEYYGRRYSDNMRFIQLGCGHVFTVEDMDRLMKGISSVNGVFQVGLKTCPSCYKAIEGCTRYNSITKDAMVSMEEMDRSNTMFVEPARDYIRQLFTTHISEEHRPFFEATFADSDTLEEISQIEKTVRWYRAISVSYVVTFGLIDAILNLKEYGSSANDDFLQMFQERIERVIDLIQEQKHNVGTCKYDPSDLQQDEYLYKVILMGFLALVDYRLVGNAMYITPNEKLDESSIFSYKSSSRFGLRRRLTPARHIRDINYIDENYTTGMVLDSLKQILDENRNKLSDLKIPKKEGRINEDRFKTHTSGVWYKCGRGHLFYHRLQQRKARSSQKKESTKWPTCEICVQFPEDNAAQKKAGGDPKRDDYYYLQQGPSEISEVQTPMLQHRVHVVPPRDYTFQKQQRWGNNIVSHQDFTMQHQPRWDNKHHGNHRGFRQRGGRSGQRGQGQRGGFRQDRSNANNSPKHDHSIDDVVSTHGSARGRNRGRGRKKGRRR